MSTLHLSQTPAATGGLVQISPSEDSIRLRLEEERRRLEREAGLERPGISHFHKPIENPCLRSQRESTTILFGGLTWKHEKLIHGALESLGYRCEPLPV
ncbi:MAG: hypothetical protein LAN62_12575, partial [Acidobacteriia bacterium]|nr:hypothetical protein [Terriglobia bacterium]